MAGTTLIDYAVNKVQGFFAGLISWNMDDVKPAGSEENQVQDSIANKVINKLTGENIGRIFADVKVTESHRFSSTVTDQTLEDGSSIHEHVIPQQPNITIQIEETNNTVGSRFSGGFFGPQQTFDKLVQLWENSVPLTVTTQHKQYKDMVITNMPILHRAPYRNALQITIDLKKLEFTKLQTTNYKASSAGVQKAASKPTNGGQQMTTTYEVKTRNLFGGV